MSAPSRYEVLVRIATGGMASVFVGRLKAQLGVSRLVALKRPHPFILADAKLRKSVIEEARTASAIHHANVVAVVDVELVEGEPVLVLEYVEGATLSELIRGTLAMPDAAFAPIAMRIVLDTARGLHAAHALGVLHRDVTPQNVLVGVDGVARLSDFGIAKSFAPGGRAEPTTTGSLKGKLGYLAPEYVASRTFVVASDLFSLAVVAWEALTTRRLFGGGTEVETLTKIIALDRPPLPPELEAFEPVLARALAREPGDRPASIEAFANELEAAAKASIGVASQAEVAAFVVRACGDALRMRKAALEAATPRPAEEMEDLPLRAATARDEVETASVTDPLPHAPPPPASAAPPAVAPPVRKSRVPPVLIVATTIVAFAGVALVFVVMAMRAPKEAATPIAKASVESPVEAPSASPAPAESSPAPPAATAPIRAQSRAVRGNRAPTVKPASSAHGPGPFPSHAPPNPYAP